MTEPSKQTTDVDFVKELLHDADVSKMIGTVSAVGSIVGAIGSALVIAAPLIGPLIAAGIGALGATGATAALREKIKKERLANQIRELVKQSANNHPLHQELMELFQQTSPDKLTTEQLLELQNKIQT